MKRLIEYWWDATDPINPGWYVVVKDGHGEVIDDSMKVWFPVNVDKYGKNQGPELENELRKVFHGSEIMQF